MKRLAIFGMIIALLATSGPVSEARPHDRTIVVTPHKLAECGPLPAAPTCTDAHKGRVWFFYNDVNDTINNTLGSFVFCQYGPCPMYDGSGENPPLGQGSAQISTLLQRRPNLATYQFGGTRFADITTLKFSTYNPSAGNGSGPAASGYLNVNVDFTGSSTTWQRRLVFVPALNGAITPNHWQEWDAVDGAVPGSKSAKWTYSGATWPTPGTTGPGSTPKTWSQILSEYPNVRVLPGDSWLGIRVGDPYPNGYTENIDAFKFGTAAGTLTFDFEPDRGQHGGGHGEDDD